MIGTTRNIVAQLDHNATVTPVVKLSDHEYETYLHLTLTHNFSGTDARLLIEEFEMLVSEDELNEISVRRTATSLANLVRHNGSNSVRPKVEGPMTYGYKVAKAMANGTAVLGHTSVPEGPSIPFRQAITVVEDLPLLIGANLSNGVTPEQTAGQLTEMIRRGYVKAPF